MDNIKNFNKPRAPMYLSNDGVTMLTKDQAIQEMLRDARAAKLANDLADSMGYDGYLDYIQKAGREAANELMREAIGLTASANDDPYILDLN